MQVHSVLGPSQGNSSQECTPGPYRGHDPLGAAMEGHSPLVEELALPNLSSEVVIPRPPNVGTLSPSCPRPEAAALAPSAPGLLVSESKVYPSQRGSSAHRDQCVSRKSVPLQDCMNKQKILVGKRGLGGKGSRQFCLEQLHIATDLVNMGRKTQPRPATLKAMVTFVLG